jgi:hypothetical protein
VLIFFIAGLLFAPRARRSLGAYRIPLETGLLIPSDLQFVEKLFRVVISRCAAT